MSRIAKQYQDYLFHIFNQNRRLFLKTLSYFTMHIGVALFVGYWITGSWALALTLSVIEPMVQSVAFFWHEKAWAKI